MKSIVHLCIVVALAVLVNGAVVKAPTTSRANLNVGYISYGDRLLFRQYVYQPARPNTIQYQDVLFRGNRTTRVSAIQATEVGYSQYASIWITSGGVGYQNVSLRVQSARGYGYYYLIDIWGR